MPNTTW